MIANRGLQNSAAAAEEESAENMIQHEWGLSYFIHIQHVVT